jgi:hypothetical protein
LQHFFSYFILTSGANAPKSGLVLKLRVHILLFGNRKNGISIARAIIMGINHLATTPGHSAHPRAMLAILSLEDENCRLQPFWALKPRLSTTLNLGANPDRERIAVDSSARRCKQSFFDHPIHLLDLPNFCISTI